MSEPDSHQKSHQTGWSSREFRVFRQVAAKFMGSRARRIEELEAELEAWETRRVRAWGHLTGLDRSHADRLRKLPPKLERTLGALRIMGIPDSDVKLPIGQTLLFEFELLLRQGEDREAIYDALVARWPNLTRDSIKRMIRDARPERGG